MNYIKKLECEVAGLGVIKETREARVQEFRQHLASSKFAAIQPDGSRGDIIAVADVQRWLRYIEEV
jgi:hypothetical protein